MRRASFGAGRLAVAGVLALGVAGGVARAAAPAIAPSGAPSGALTSEQAVAIALERNHDAIAARLELSSAELDRVQAGLYWNPQLSYTLGNIVAGPANPQGSPPIRPPGAFGQPVQTVGLSEVIDVWAKRSQRLRAANRSIEHRRLLTEDALREIAWAVRSAFADVLREQSELRLVTETRKHYDETVRLSRARFSAGDISEAELKKVELEGLKYQNAEIEGQLELDLARQKLAALLSLTTADQLPALTEEDRGRRPLDLKYLIERAFADRPDVRAVASAKLVTEAQLAQARREAFPDIALGLGYTHSDFTVSGDNPNTFALSLALPLPIFDRNQANIGKARIEIQKAENEAARLAIAVQHEVTDAVRRAQKAAALLDVYEGGMLDRADSALRVAEKSYRAGSSSLLDLLEAQRTYLDTKADYLRAQHDYRQAIIDVRHATGDRQGEGT